MATIGNYFFNGPLGEGEAARFERTVRPTLRHLDYAFWALGALLLGLTARLAWHIWLLPWGAWGDWFRSRPEGAQIATIAALALAFYAADNLSLALLLYAVLGIFIAWRFDLGLAAVAFAIPFYLQGKALASLHFSMVELLLLLCAFVFVVRRPTTDDRRPTGALWARRPAQQPRTKEGRAKQFPQSLISNTQSLLSTLLPRDGLEWALLLFALWAGVSVLLAQRFGVAAREFRVVVAESVLWFWLLRRAGLSQAGRWRVLDALLVASTLVALFGLYQWLFTADIIQAEGVRRVRSVYGSPNNLALLLERVLPICGAGLLLAPRGRRRVGYALATVPLSLALFLTFSRGAWLLGLPAALLWIGWWGGDGRGAGWAQRRSSGCWRSFPFWQRSASRAWCNWKMAPGLSASASGRRR